MKFKIILNGRLGNQMFQYAFAKALSEYHNAELYIQKPIRNYMLEKIFGIKNIIDNSILWNKSITECSTFDIKNIDSKYFTKLINDNYKIIGYWQNEEYFKKYENLIRKIYNIDPIYLDKNDLIMHVRRGDYVNDARYFYCDLNWYKKAINLFNYKRLFIVSDDPDWCEENFYDYNSYILRINELDTLRYLAGASNIIISNSTFSWWGAWLSNTNNVICPSVWLPMKKNWKTQRKIWKQLDQ